MSAAAVCALVPSSEHLAAALRGDRLIVADPFDLAGAVEMLPATGVPVVLVGEQRHEAAVQRIAAVASDAGHRVAVRLLPHGPAALVLVAREAAHAGADAAQAPALVDELARGAWSGAWVPSVTRLADPAPSFGQHVASALPGGGGYVVTLAGGERGVTAAKKAVATDEASRPAGGVTSGKLPSAGRSALLRAAGTPDVVTLVWLTVNSAERFGSSRAVEAVALALDGRTALTRLRAEREPCAVCGMRRFTPTCPYCRVRPSVQLETVPGGNL